MAVPAHADALAPSWPIASLPDGVSRFAVGEQLTLNGLPMRLHGFVSPLPPSDLLPQLRRSLGQPLVETRSGDQQVLGRAQGQFYVSVQVGASGTGSRGTVAVTRLGLSVAERQEQGRERARWIERLPAGSKLASELSSRDGNRAAHQLVIVNALDEERNRDALLALMTGDGYRLEREVGVDAAARPSLPYQLGAARTLYFSAPGKEAMAVISRSGTVTSIVLNTVASLQAYR